MESYHQTLLAPEVIVCGRRLRSYTLWHHALLSALRSPFLDPAGHITGPDLLIALHACRPAWPARPRTRPTLLDLWWRRRLRHPDRLRYHAAAFGTWLDLHTRGPLFFRDEKRKGGGLTAPETLGLAYGLTSIARISQSEAWNTSPAMAQYILGAVAELRGAELIFADPDELTEENAPIQPTTREEVLARATRDLGERAANDFIRQWDRHHPNGSSQP